ncbi:hypothetical protein BVG79_00686 [Ketogulonicigenium robustum]|uniref:DNA polymerase III subunit gamma/tau n=1 Tax=Ketogulonicigenium robustum TaxID=92947 RepID=A0A1W6NXS2_9RHOB|nr:SRPBCC family protein [Ketogulonicigenium robustum]ARO14038.1 hypothetical protein BVG79_00686 [Ketogulonicigenium robustum]
MQFVVNDHVAVGPQTLFDHISDVALLEQMVKRGGASIHRTDGGSGATVGASWMIGVPFRGRTQDVSMKLVEVQAPRLMRIAFASGGVEGEISLVLTPAEGAGTDTVFTMEMGANSLIGRLLLQSLKLARGTISNRIRKRVGNYLHLAEARARA